jgi:hypothetical protein
MAMTAAEWHWYGLPMVEAQANEAAPEANARTSPPEAMPYDNAGWFSAAHTQGWKLLCVEIVSL